MTTPKSPGAGGLLGPGALTGFSGPHAAAQGDVYFGFNAYFGSRFTPSKVKTPAILPCRIDPCRPITATGSAGRTSPRTIRPTAIRPR